MIAEGKVICTARNKEVLIQGEVKYEYSFVPVHPDPVLIQGAMNIILADKDKFVLGTQYTLTLSAVAE